MSNECFVFSATWFGGRNAQPNVHQAFQVVCKRFVYQLEECPTTGSLHYQCYLNLKRKCRAGKLAKTLSALGLKGVTCSPASAAGKERLRLYAMKNDTRVAGPWADRHIYLGDDLPSKLRPWQHELKEYIEGPIDPRKIVWYHDAKGGAGKSTFSKYMMFHHQIPTLTFGNASDLLNLVYKFQGERAYIFDLSRTKSKNVAMEDIYAALESIKNGYFVNTKYETGIAIFSKPHVVVFSNYAPNMSALSADKWDIRRMEF